MSFSPASAARCTPPRRNPGTAASPWSYPLVRSFRSTSSCWSPAFRPAQPFSHSSWPARLRRRSWHLPRCDEGHPAGARRTTHRHRKCTFRNRISWRGAARVRIETQRTRTARARNSVLMAGKASQNAARMYRERCSPVPGPAVSARDDGRAGRSVPFWRERVMWRTCRIAGVVPVTAAFSITRGDAARQLRAGRNVLDTARITPATAGLITELLGDGLPVATDATWLCAKSEAAAESDWVAAKAWKAPSKNAGTAKARDWLFGSRCCNRESRSNSTSPCESQFVDRFHTAQRRRSALPMLAANCK